MATMTVEINLTRKTVIQVVCQVELHLFVVLLYYYPTSKLSPGNTTGATYGAETAYPSKAPGFTSGF